MAERDPYTVLGVEKTATADAIRKAYRRLAKKHHPDLNPGDAEAERQFKEAANANAILSDPAQRARFDRGEIDASGHERAPMAAEAPFGRGAGFAAQEGFASEADLQDFLKEMFGKGAGGGGPRRPRPARGADQVMTITVPFGVACLGGVRRVRLPTGASLDVTMPPGLQEGELIRLTGKGEAGYDGGPPGDLFIEAHIAAHPYFERKGDDILLDLPITFAEAVLGGTVRAPTLHGPVDVKAPAGAKAGQRLRLAGKGASRRGGGSGDQIVRLVIVAPEAPDDELKACLAAWAKRRPENPRAKLEDTT